MPRRKKLKIMVANAAPNILGQIINCCHDLNVEFSEYPIMENSDVANLNLLMFNWDLLLINTDDISKAIDVCAIVRSAKPLSQIIVLSSSRDDSANAKCLAQCADDFISIPFSSIELSARIASALRRIKDIQPLISKLYENSPAVMTTTNAEDFTDKIKIYPISKNVVISGQSISLTQTELSLMSYLISKKGKSCSKLELLEKALGYEDECYLPSLYTHINRLRRKLKQKKIVSLNIETDWRYGYRLVFKYHERASDLNSANSG